MLSARPWRSGGRARAKQPPTGNLRKAADGLSSPVVVGDRVLVEELPDGAGLIREVAPRRSEFRRVRWRKPPQVVAANIDQALVAVAAAEPQPNFSLVRPLPPAGCAAGIPPHLVTKSDLLTGETREMFEIYRRAGWPLHHQQRHGGESDDVTRWCDRVSLITGTSGVGRAAC